VQVESAWGVLDGTESCVGIEEDFVDFPFIEILGFSSYPYFSFVEPEDIPNEYFSGLLNGRSMRTAVCEGGWSSASVGAVTSSLEKQERYIRRLGQAFRARNVESSF
jgi:hypothetical protein